MSEREEQVRALIAIADEIERTIFFREVDVVETDTSVLKRQIVNHIRGKALLAQAQPGPLSVRCLCCGERIVPPSKWCDCVEAKKYRIGEAQPVAEQPGYEKPLFHGPECNCIRCGGEASPVAETPPDLLKRCEEFQHTIYDPDRVSFAGPVPWWSVRFPKYLADFVRGEAARASGSPTMTIASNHPPFCGQHGDELVQMVLHVYDRPGSPPGNNWVCPRQSEHRATASPAGSGSQSGPSGDVVERTWWRGLYLTDEEIAARQAAGSGSQK